MCWSVPDRHSICLTTSTELSLVRKKSAMLATASSSMPVKTALDVSPDDSDLVDISLTQVQDTKVPGISATADAPSPIPSSTPAVRDAALKKLPKLVHGLIPVSNRFWFAVFPKLVDADQLNVGDGLAMAHIPELSLIHI